MTPAMVTIHDILASQEVGFELPTLSFPANRIGRSESMRRIYFALEFYSIMTPLAKYCHKFIFFVQYSLIPAFFQKEILESRQPSHPS